MQFLHDKIYSLITCRVANPAILQVKWEHLVFDYHGIDMSQPCKSEPCNYRRYLPLLYTVDLPRSSACKRLQELLESIRSLHSD